MLTLESHALRLWMQGAQNCSEMKLLDYTPVEKYDGVWVKREDLCCDMVKLSKIRGAWRHLKGMNPRPRHVVCVDTFRSLNGLVTAICCNELKIRCTIVHPTYKGQKTIPPQQMRAKKEFGADLWPTMATRQAIMTAHAKDEFKSCYFMPAGFRLEETRLEVAEQYQKTLDRWGRPDVLVVPVGVGVHLAGLMRVVQRERVYGVLGYSRYVRPTFWLKYVDLGYQYDDQSRIRVPFPASPYYEAKAWKWLVENRDQLRGKVLFWNIGA